MGRLLIGPPFPFAGLPALTNGPFVLAHPAPHLDFIKERATCAHLDSQAQIMSLSLTRGNSDRSGRAAPREPASFSRDDCTLPTLFQCP